ncbi:MAG: response regulator transcription factor [Blautia sp.]|nr:response regulator transcription factor [Blautia sp.]
MIRCAVVEDEKEYAECIRAYAQRFSQETGNKLSLRFFSDGEDIVSGYSSDLDIILMDIKMHVLDGMSAARRVRELDDKVIIMFITNLPGYAIEAYEVEAFDYILKPISYEMFSRKLLRAISRVRRREDDTIILQTKEGIRRVEVGSIAYIESRGHQMEVHTENGLLLLRGKLDELEEKLRDHGFVRSNRGYLVNLYHIQALEGECLVVQGEKLPVSRSRRAELIEKLTGVL